MASLRIKACLIFLAAFFPLFASAQGDLSIEVIPDETSLRPAGSTDSVIVRLTNLGPEPVTVPASRVEVPNFGILPVDFFQIPGENCTVALGVLEPFDVNDPIIFVYTFSSPDLPAGSSSDCRANNAVNPNFEGEIALTWVIRSLPIQPIDPDISNNRATLAFGTPLPVQVPALFPMSVALMVTLFCLIATTKKVMRRPTGD